MRFHRTTLSDVLEQLPQLENASAVAVTGLPPFDLLVAVNGFEDRTAAVPEWLVREGVTIPQTMLVHYPSNIDDNRRTMDALDEALSRVSATVLPVEFGITAPKLREALTNASTIAAGGTDVARILLDISGASGRMVLRFMRSLFELAATSELKVDLTIAYAEAAEYAPTQNQARELIDKARQPGESTLGLDFDAEELSPSVEYPGQHIEHVPDRAIVICGFNADRARAALDHIETAFNIDPPHSRVTYIAGRPPKEADHWRLQAMMDINSAVEVANKMDFTATSTLHYQETLQKLEGCYEEAFGRERVTVLPFGSKMQTVATALFCEMHPDVKVQLLAPARYAGAHYSEGCGEIHLLRLGDLGQTAQVLRQVGQLVER